MSTALAKIETADLEAFDAADLSASGSMVRIIGESAVGHALRVSSAMQELRDALPRSVVRGLLQKLAGSPLGFQMDRDSYSDDVVRDCAIQAIAHGLPLVGNRWNIIGGRLYVRKEGFEDLCSRECRFTPSVKIGELPANAFAQGGYVSCTVTITYQRHGSEEKERHVGMYRVKLNKKSKIPEDVLEGKARRKALRDLWKILTGIQLADGDAAEVAATNGGQSSRSLLPSATGLEPEVAAIVNPDEPPPMSASERRKLDDQQLALGTEG
jgi:hypothetical protein